MHTRASFALALAAALAACSQLTPGQEETPEQAMANEIAAAEPCRTQITEAAAQAAATGEASPLINRLVIGGRDRILWNDMAIDAVRLRQYLDLSHVMSPQPRLVVSAEPGTDPAHVRAVREAIYRAMNCAAAIG